MLLQRLVLGQKVKRNRELSHLIYWTLGTTIKAYHRSIFSLHLLAIYCFIRSIGSRPAIDTWDIASTRVFVLKRCTSLTVEVTREKFSSRFSLSLHGRYWCIHGFPERMQHMLLPRIFDKVGKYCFANFVQIEDRYKKPNAR